MSIFDAIILGAVEGISEFLPISSTGHLILANALLGIQETEFVKSFDIIIQLGAIAAAAALYWKRFLDIEVIKRVLVAFVPTGVIGLLLYKIVKEFLLGNQAVVVASLFLGGIALIFFEYGRAENQEEGAQALRDMTYTQALYIGLFQAISIIPGVSRSAATIVGGMVTTKLSRAAIVEFSFLLAIPTMLAATGLDLVKNASSFAGADIVSLFVGFSTAAAVALFAMRFLLSYVRNHSFVAFGIYRIVIAILFFIFFLR